MVEIATNVDETAIPDGGFYAYYGRLSQGLVYPDEARRQGIEGKVMVEFVVQPDGRLTDFKVLRGIGAGCDAAAMAALMETTGWKPAVHEGQIVAQRLVLPINFQLN
jgi:protein TonB